MIMMTDENPYKVLGVSTFCSEKEAKSRYRYLSRMYHPDNLKTGDGDKFRKINEAWKKLQEYGFNDVEDVCWTHSTLFKIKTIRR